MKKLFKKYKYQIILILTGIIWLTFLNELMQIKNQNNICNDCDNYRESASYLYHNFKTHYFRPIGMALITGLPYLFGATDASVYVYSLIINVLAWLCTALLLFSLLKKVLSKRKALIYTFLFYSIIGSVFINFMLLTESIFTFLILAVFYYLKKYYEKKDFHYLSISISIILFSILVKPGIKIFAILFFIYFGKILIKNYRKRSILFVFLSVSLIVFQCVKTKKDYGNYTLSYIDSVTYYNYIGSKAMYYKTNDILNQDTSKRRAFLEKHSYLEQRNIANNDMLYQIKNNKFNLIKAYISDLIDNTKSPSSAIYRWENIENKKHFDFTKNWLFVISKYQNRFFTIIGCILGLYYIFREYRHNFFYSLLSFYILYIIAISGISCSEGDRFHIVCFPFVIILLAKACSECNFKNFDKKIINSNSCI